MDNDLALKIYIKARATPKVVAAFAERREFDKILIYSKQVDVVNVAGFHVKLAVQHCQIKSCFYMCVSAVFVCLYTCYVHVYSFLSLLILTY